LQDHEESPLLLPPLQAAGGGRGLAACVAGGCQDGWQWQSQWQLFEQKGVGQGKRKGGIERWVCFFMLSYFVIVFGLPFWMQVDWFLIKIKSIVGWASFARFLFQSSKFGHHIFVKQL
jgi:hypothetical protein